MGKSERDGRTIMNMTCCLLNETKLPHFLWNEIAATSVYLLNRIPNKTIDMDTSHRRMLGNHASLAHLRIIGARAFVHQPLHTGKLEEKAWEGRLVGYDANSPTYRIYNPASRNIIRSRNVTFIESPKITSKAEDLGDDEDTPSQAGKEQDSRPFTRSQGASKHSRPTTLNSRQR